MSTHEGHFMSKTVTWSKILLYAQHAHTFLYCSRHEDLFGTIYRHGFIICEEVELVCSNLNAAAGVPVSQVSYTLK